MVEMWQEQYDLCEYQAMLEMEMLLPEKQGRIKSFKVKLDLSLSTEPTILGFQMTS